MASIVNGLFAGRAGISSHGVAIAVVGDNISNASTIGYKATRSEFEDLVAGGQAAGRIVGSGSTNSAVSTIFTQGTLEFTSRPLDLAIDGNGYFVLEQGQRRFYTRAGNFKVNESGDIVSQGELPVLGFPAGGSGSLETLNVNTVSQSSVATTAVEVSGNVDASTATVTAAAVTGLGVSVAGATASTTTYAQLNQLAAFSTVVDVFDSLGDKHTVTYFFYHTDDPATTTTQEWNVRGYVNSEDVDPGATPAVGLPREISSTTMIFDGSGTRTNTPALGTADVTATIPWNNSSNAGSIATSFRPFTQYSSASNILSLTQDGKGVGAVTSVNIEKNGDIFAILSNGQSAVIGTVGLVNFSNAEGLTRIGKNLLQQSAQSGEPIVGRAQSGQFGAIQAGSLELSTVDTATEFVKLITLQRGFQASSRIITTINQLLQEIIQLA